MSKTITLTDEQYQALQNGEEITIKPPKKVWRPETRYLSRIVSPSEDRLRFLQQVDGLLDYRDQFAPGYVVPEIGGPAWYVYYSRSTGYDISCDLDYRDVCKVYMPESVAKELARKLKSGEVVL